MPTVYGWILVALGCWAAFTTVQTVAASRGLREHRALAAIGVGFVATCFLPGIALLAEAFAPWMLIPLGTGFLFLLPFPCYFSWANEGWIRTARNLLFAAVGTALVAAGLGLVRLGWFGL